MSCTLKKKVCDSLLNTILGMDKSKDTNNARKDLTDMKIRPKLHLCNQGDKLMKLAVDFMLTPEERRQFVISSNQLSFLTILLQT